MFFFPGSYVAITLQLSNSNKQNSTPRTPTLLLIRFSLPPSVFPQHIHLSPVPSIFTFVSMPPPPPLSISLLFIIIIIIIIIPSNYYYYCCLLFQKPIFSSIPHLLIKEANLEDIVGGRHPFGHVDVPQRVPQKDDIRAPTQRLKVR